jgi:iron complex outermembrane receptor protein
LATGFAFSQDCNLKLTGKVMGVHDNAPLEAAVIQVVGSNTATITSASGTFVLDNLCAEKVKLKISHLNCKMRIKEVDVKESVYFEFFLDHHVESLEEVIVAKQKTDKYSSTSKVYSLTESQKDRFNAKGLAGALEQISGVNMMSTGSSIAKPVIHGMFGSRVGIVYNGTMLENQQWGQDHAPNVDINAFENVRIIKGAGTLKYSGATPGGMVILESTYPKPIDSLFGKTILTGMTNGRGASLISSWTKSYRNGTYIKAQGTIKRNGDYSAPDYILTNTGADEKNLSVSLGKNGFHHKWKMSFSYFTSEIGILKSAHIGNVRDLLSAIESTVPNVIDPFSYTINYPKQVNNHYTSNLEYAKYFGANQKLNITYSWQKNNRQEFDVRRGALKNTAAIDLQLNTHDLTSNYAWTSSLGTFDSGLFFQLQDNYSNPKTEIKRLIPDYLRTKLGGYATASLSPNQNVNFGFGVRYELQYNDVQKYYLNSRWNSEGYESLLGSYVINEVPSQKLIRRKLVFNTLAFNAGARFNTTPSYSIGLNYNYSQRAPDIAEMFSDGLHHSLATIEYGNPFLTKETTHKIILDFDKKSGAFIFNLSPFLTYGDDFIIIEPTGVEQTIRGAFPIWEYSSVNAVMKGVDFDFTYALSPKVELKHSTSWIHGTNVDTNTPLINIPPLTISNQIQFSLPQWNTFFVRLNSQNTLRQRRFPNNNFSKSLIEDGEKVDKIVDISTPPNGYHTLGIELNWGPYALSTSKVNVAVSFDNILNANYRDYLNRLRYYADEMGRNIMLQIKISH